MWELDCEEGWVRKNWCFWTVVLEKTLESPLDCKEIQPVHSEGDQPWGFFGGNDAKGETPVLWPPHAKSWLIVKDSDAGRDWGQEEKGMTQDEMAGWHHWLDGRESEWTQGVGDGQGRPGTLLFMGLQRVGHDWATELNWIINGCWILSEAFLASIEIYLWFLTFQFVNIVYHIGWFAYTEESLHSWNKPNLIMVYELFDVLLNSVCQKFAEDFCICVHQCYWLVFLWFWYQGDGALLEWVWKCSFLCIFWKEF